MTRDPSEKEQGSGTGVSPRLTRHGGLTYLEIPAVDASQSAAFYENVFGWKVDERQTDDFRFEDATGHLIGRWVIGRTIAVESGFMPYFYVDRITDILNQLEAHGGAIVKEPYPEGNLWIATIHDPAGNLIGLWQMQGTHDG